MNGFIYSIIVCTYNPHPDIFRRLLNALLDFPTSIVHEVIIVDNSSSPPLAELEDVKCFLSGNANASIINEPKPGLTNARLAGIKAAKSDWLIFFDDDNEPCADYLEVSKRLIEIHPDAGAWGPGLINVAFAGGTVSEWVLSQKQLFQERKVAELKKSTEKSYQDFYPHGTGLVIRKTIAQTYVAYCENGLITLTDRLGTQLSSGGDTQLVLLGIKEGWSAGVCPDLRLNHNIDSRKANPNYLKKQVYFTSASYHMAYNEVFPDEKLVGKLGRNIDVIKSLYAAYRIHHGLEPASSFKLRCARILGEYASPYNAAGLPKPFILAMMEKYFIL